MGIARAAAAAEPQASSLGLIVRRARVRYRAQPLIDGLDLSLAAGETSALLGPSGVGKSSLLRLIAGLLQHDGAADIGTDDGAGAAGRLAYMDQRDLLLPWLNVEDNVLLGARLRGERRDRARARALLGAVGLADAAKAMPATLSGGMRQRVALARTLMEDRPIVLMDEPFSALDALTRLRLQDLAADLLCRRTVLLVTHDPLEALRLAHRVLVLGGLPARLVGDFRPAGAPPRPAAQVAASPDYGALLARLGVPA